MKFLNHKPTKWHFEILFILTLFFFFGERIYSQNMCGTPSNTSNFLKGKQSTSQLKLAASSYTINIFFHIIRRSDGSGGQTPQEVNTAFNTLVSDFKPYNIFFSLLGTDEIKSDDYYNNYNEANDFKDSFGAFSHDMSGKFDKFNGNLFNANTHINAIDIYLFANNKLNMGLSTGIPATALVIGGNRYNTNLASSHVLSHEVGHCLGLYHTFQGTNQDYDSDGCPELVNGSNGNDCGDYIKDTPADPCWLHDCQNQSTCVWNCSNNYHDANGQTFHPDVHNFMSYARPNCMSHYTPGQVEVMFSTIANSCLLQNTLISLSGPSVVCSNGTYEIKNLPSGYNVTWSSSSNLKLQSSSANTATFTNVLSSQLGYVQPTRIICVGLCDISLPSTQVWTGEPVISKVTGPTYCEVGGSGSYRANLVDVRANATSYNWAIMPNKNNYFYHDGDYCSIQWSTASNYALSVNATNTCGTSFTYWYPIWVVSKNSLSLSPNPASNNIQVSIIKTQNTALTSDTEVATYLLKTTVSQDITSSYTVKIYNSFGTLFYSSKQTGDSFTIPVNNLKDGTYIVEANDGKQSYKQTLVIKH